MEFESWKSQRLPRDERQIGFWQQILPPALTSESIASANRLAEIVQSVALFARDDPQKMAPVNIEGVLQAAITLTWHELKQRATVNRELSGVPPIVGSASELALVFVHLLRRDPVDRRLDLARRHGRVEDDDVGPQIWRTCRRRARSGRSNRHDEQCDGDRDGDERGAFDSTKR